MYNLNTAAPSQLAKALLAAAFLLALLLPASVFAEGEEQPVKAPGGTVSTAEGLNQALGGNHEVAGNTVTLQADVNLEKRIDLKTYKSLTLNLNGKTIRCDKTDDAAYCMIHMESDMTIKGEGTMEAAGEGVSVIAAGGRCSLNIQDADIRTLGKGSCGIRAVGSAADCINVNLNGGTMKSPWNNVLLGEGVVQGEGAIVHLNVKDAVLDGTIFLQAPETYIDNVEAISGDYNTFVLNGGVITHFIGEMTSATIKSGTIQSINFFCGSYVRMQGGTISECRLNDVRTTMKMSGGTVCNVNCSRIREFMLTGGVIAGTGLDLDGGKLTMKGGTIQSSDGEALKLCTELDDRSCAATISGGVIQTTKNGARGVSINGASALTLKGGVIKSTAPKSSSAGIYASGSKAKVKLEGTKKGAAYVKGYKYGLYRNGKAACQISKNTKVYAPKAAKRSYTKSKNLPKIVKGNITVKYKKLI